MSTTGSGASPAPEALAPEAARTPARAVAVVVAGLVRSGERLQRDTDGLV